MLRKLALHALMSFLCSEVGHGQTYMAQNPQLMAYWDDEGCGPYGDDYNWEWCKETHFQCQKTVCTTLCPNGQAELVYTRGSGYLGALEIDGCSYAYIAQYRCTEQLANAEKCHYLDPEHHVIANPKLVAYWDEHGCGPMGDDHNKDWCHSLKGKCKKIACTTECPSGQAELVYMRGNGRMGSVRIKDCNYAYFAQYRCLEEPKEDTCYYTDKKFLDVANPRLVAYWDEGNCGPQGDDHNKDWCHDRKGKCKKIACTTECPTGQARIVYQRGTGYMGSVNINGCFFAYYAQYECMETPKRGKCQYTDPNFLAIRNPKLVAYWDDEVCGPQGDDYNWQWCKEMKAQCSKFVCTSLCPSGQAELVYKRGGKYMGSVTIDGCSYAYFAQYHCSDKSTAPCVSVKITKREEF